MTTPEDQEPGASCQLADPPRLPRPGVGQRFERKVSRLLGGQGVFLITLAVVIGVAGGYGAILFRELIRLVNRVAFPTGIELTALFASPWYGLVAPPAVGGLIVAPMVYLFAREAKGHGVPEVMDACHHRGGRIRPRVAFVKILASALSIGTGGSVGREGPIVQIGSSVGSSTGQFFGLQGDRLKTMVASGAAAGIAATFNAPIAGVLFATEVILGRGSAKVFSPLIVASVIATVVTRLHLGNFPAFQVAPYDLVSPWELPLYVVLGALSALVGVGFTKGLYALEDAWEAVPTPEYTKGVLGGALVGVVALKFPEIMGVGYELIEQVLHWESGHIALGTMQGAGFLLLLVAVKIFATGTTIGSGGSGGIFAPSLFIGASLGGAFGTVANAVMPRGTVAGASAYGLVAMGAVVSATTHAPLTAILIVFELTDRHTIILPLMLSCILATGMAMWLSRESIYTLKLLRRGARLAHGAEAELMTQTQVSTLTRPVDQTLHPETPFLEVVEQVIENHHPRMYVTDSTGRLHGVVVMEDVASVLRDEEILKGLLVGADVMRLVTGTVRPEDTLDHCLDRLSRRQVDELPVVDADRRLLGRITRADVIALYNREILRQEAVLRFVEEAEPGAAGEARVHLASGEVKEQIAVDGALTGRSLKELNLRARFGVTVFAVRQSDGESAFPDPRAPLRRGQILEVHGPPEEVTRVRALARRNARSAPGLTAPAQAPGPKTGSESDQ